MRLDAWGVLFASFFCSLAHAGILWHSTRQSVDMPPSDEKVVMIFPFKNGGTTVESIISVDADCGCVTIDGRKQNDFAPGESGKIVANVEVRKKRGIIEKHISVLTTDHPDEPTILTARIVILPSAEMGKPELSWEKDEALQEKEVPIILRKKLETRLPPLALDANDALQVDLLPASDTEGPRLRVKPRNLGLSGMYTIFVEVKGAGETFSLPLLVKLGG